MKWIYIVLITGVIALIVGGIYMSKQGVSIQSLLGTGIPSVTAQSSQPMSFTSSYNMNIGHDRKIIMENTSYIEEYIDFNFKELNNSLWVVNFTIDPVFYNNIRIGLALPVGQRNAYFVNLCNTYFSQSLSCDSQTATNLTNDFANLINYPRTNLTNNIAFSNLNINLTDGTGSFYMIFKNNRFDGERFKLGFHSSYFYTIGQNLNTARWGSPAGSNRFLAGTEANSSEYNQMSSINQSWAERGSDALNDEPFWRFNFTVNEPPLSITSFSVDFTGWHNASGEAGVVSIYNFTSLAWVVIATMNSTNSNVSINISNSDVKNFINTNLNQIIVAFEGTNFDVLDGDKLFVDYIGLTVYYQLTPVPWQVNTSVWDLSASTLVVSTQDTAPSGMFFKPDGTRLYISGNTNDGVYSYSLSTPWMINTSTWEGSVSNFSIASQDLLITGIFFKDDGTKMYFVGQTNDRVYSYSLSTPWMINTSVWEGTNSDFSVATQENNPSDIFFKPDGTRMYIIGETGDSVYSYSLSTPWMINTSTWEGTTSNMSFASQDAIGLGLFFKPDGTKMYFGGTINDRIYSYSLSTPWMINTSVWEGTLSNKSIGAQGTNIRTMSFKPDGTKMYTSNGEIHSYSMPDSNAPLWSSNSTNSTLAGTLVNHSLIWTDNALLNNYTFSFDNGTGTFVNDSSVSFSGVTNQSWAVQKVNSTVGSTIRWRVYTWDYTGNNNLTSIFTYTTTSASSNCWTYDSPTKYLQIPTGCLYVGNLTP